jgi:hypothetical protein
METARNPLTSSTADKTNCIYRLITGVNKIFLILIFFIGFTGLCFSQNALNEINYTAESKFVPTIKDARKFSDLPEIKDSVKRITDIKYGITSSPLFPKYKVQTIDPAKIQNEPLPKLYHSLLKIGYGPIYNMPYGEFWIGNTRSRDKNFGAHLKHFSSTTHLRNAGYGAFSDNAVNIYGKQFYKKHTLSGDLNYDRSLVHYYGYDTSINKVKNDYTKQRYQIFEPKVRLQSHYTDSSHFNHDIQLSYYNLQNLHREEENNFKLNALGSMFIQKEKLNIDLFTDFYNHRQSNDTLNNFIASLHPSFEAGGTQWHADIGLTGTLDHFKGQTRFYVYPKLNVQYDVFESVVIPYAGLTGGLIKNSFRSLSRENPFIDTTIRYTNTNNKYNAFAGLKGNLSSSTSYDAKVTYSQHDSMYFYVIDYNSPVQMHNHFNVIYDNSSLLTVSGQMKYQFKEKIVLIGKGTYYMWRPKNLTRAYHKPDFDLTFSAIYNLQSKIIVRADLFLMGNQWALNRISDQGITVPNPIQVKGWADFNLEAEYRYSKMLSFFTRLSNLANQRYYRWERYPTQKFNFMIGLTFVPF